MYKYLETSGIIRSIKSYGSYNDLADEYIIKAFKVYKECWFFSKSKKLRLIKELAESQLLDIRDNLCSSNWVCVSKDETKKKSVKTFLNGAIESIDIITELKISKL
jgi:hypothetical protein